MILFIPAYRMNIKDEPIKIAKNISKDLGILLVISRNKIAWDKNHINGKIEKATILTPNINNLLESLLTDIFTILPFN